MEFLKEIKPNLINMAKIDTDQINWTPIGVIFTIVSGCLAGFWAYINLYFKNKSKEREDFLEKIVGKIVEEKISIQQARDSERDLNHKEQFTSMWSEIKALRKSMDAFNENMINVLREVKK